MFAEALKLNPVSIKACIGFGRILDRNRQRGIDFPRSDARLVFVHVYEFRRGPLLFQKGAGH